MSAPAVKARAPAPGSTMHRQGPRSSSSHSRTSSAIIARDMAFMRAWLSIVRTTTWPCSSTRISMALSGARPHHELAVGLAVGQPADRLDAALERQAVADQRPQLALAIPLQQLLDPDLPLVPARARGGAARAGGSGAARSRARRDA